MKDVDALTTQAAEYHRKGNYDQAIEAHLEALHVLEETVGANHIDTAKRYRDIGSAMGSAGCADKALEQFNAALKTLKNLEEEKTNDDEAKVLHGQICKLMGNLLFRQEDYKGAKETFSEAMECLKLTPVADKSELEEIEYLIEVSGQMMDD